MCRWLFRVSYTFSLRERRRNSGESSLPCLGVRRSEKIQEPAPLAGRSGCASVRPALHVSRLLLAAFAKALLRLSELRLFPMGLTHTPICHIRTPDRGLTH